MAQDYRKKNETDRSWHRTNRRPGAWGPVLVCLVGLMVTLAATVQVSLMIDGKEELRFQAWVEKTHKYVQDRMQARVTALQHLTIGLLADDEGPVDYWFRQQVRQLMEEDPSISGIGLAIDQAWADAAAEPEGRGGRTGDDGADWESQPISIYFRKGVSPGGLAVTQFDLDSEPALQNALAQALASREPVTSEALVAANESGEDRTALAIIIPLGQSEDAAPDQPALVGCVYAIVDSESLWHGLLPQGIDQRLLTAVYLGDQPRPEALLWSRRGAAQGPRRGTLEDTRQVEAAGGTYTLAFRSTSAFEAASLHWPVVLGTLVVGVLVTAGLTLLSRSQTAAWQAAQQHSLDLHESRLKLEQVNQTLEQRVADRTAVAANRAEQLRGLAWQLTQAEQVERRRLARVLHDHLQQLLVAARMQAHQLSRQAAATAGDGGSVRTGAGDQLNELLNEAIDVSRSLTIELSPPVLYSGGLLAALEWLGRQNEHKYQLRMHLDADEGSRAVEGELGEKIRVFLFDAVRELLFNVVKYAQVDEVEVGLRWLAEERRLQVEVVDRGVGFDATTDRAQQGGEDGEGGGFGLFSVRERLQLLGGEMEVRSAPGEGTRVCLSLPLELQGAQPQRQDGQQQQPTGQAAAAKAS